MARSPLPTSSVIRSNSIKSFERAKDKTVLVTNPKLRTFRHPLSLALIIVFFNLVVIGCLCYHYSWQCERHFDGFVTLDGLDARATFFTNADLWYPLVYVSSILMWNTEGSGTTLIYTAEDRVQPKSSFYGIIGDTVALEEECTNHWFDIQDAFSDRGFTRDYVEFLHQQIGNSPIEQDLDRARATMEAIHSRKNLPWWNSGDYNSVIEKRFNCMARRDERSETPRKGMSKEEFLEVYGIIYRTGVMVATNMKATIECDKQATWSECLHTSGQGYTTQAGRGIGPMAGMAMTSAVLNANSIAAAHMSIEYHTCHPLDEVLSLALAWATYADILITLVVVTLYLTATCQWKDASAKVKDVMKVEVGGDAEEKLELGEPNASAIPQPAEAPETSQSNIPQMEEASGSAQSKDSNNPKLAEGP